MDALRNKAGKPTLPVWFVAFGDGIQSISLPRVPFATLISPRL